MAAPIPLGGHPMAIAPLSSSYAEARTAFVAAAEAVGARLESFPHPRTGLEGEALAVDVAELGPAHATSVVLVVSGTHGVEGYLGSALQRHHLEMLAANGFDVDAEGPALVFVHALNPFGFSWVRRVNEDNVDLNRNFIDWTQPPPSNDDYSVLADTLVPASWTEEVQERMRGELLTKLSELGFDRAQQIISGGQFDHPTGVFYGGTGPTWSHQWLRDFLGRRLANVERAAIIDLHTGLGPWGHAELISSEPVGSDALARQRAWWTDVTALRDGSSVSADVSGEWLGVVADFAPTTEVTGIAIEYGTVDPVTILNSLRADAVLHASGAQTAQGADAVRAEVRAAFVDDDPAWLQACWPAYDTVVHAAIKQLSPAT